MTTSFIQLLDGLAAQTRFIDRGDAMVAVCQGETCVVPYKALARDLLTSHPLGGFAGFAALDGPADPDVIEIQQIASELSPAELGAFIASLDGTYSMNQVLGALDAQDMNTILGGLGAPQSMSTVLGDYDAYMQFAGLEGRKERRARRKKRRKKLFKKLRTGIKKVAKKAAKKGVLRKALYKVASKIPVVKYAAKGGRGVVKGITAAVKIKQGKIRAGDLLNVFKGY